MPQNNIDVLGEGHRKPEDPKASVSLLLFISKKKHELTRTIYYQF